MTQAWSKAPVREEGVDLSRLNAAERTVLDLLAQGHTAKSIATITGRSVGSVNERLREARRKTGIGSSRELARLFAAQESRDDLIGVASELGVASGGPRVAISGRLSKGSMLMTIGLIGAATAVALLLLNVPQTADGEAVSLIGTSFGSAAADPRALNSRFLAEKRDDPWASDTEAALETRIAPIPNVGPMKVKCAATLCQVAGWIGPADAQQTNAAMGVIQSERLRADMLKLKLVDGAIWFASDTREAGKTSFVMFWKRTGA
jgi:DNA-binding CsgD family transcriptional regulator